MDSCEEKASLHPETQKKEEPNPKKIKLNAINIKNLSVYFINASNVCMMNA